MHVLADSERCPEIKSDGAERASETLYAVGRVNGLRCTVFKMQVLRISTAIIPA